MLAVRLDDLSFAAFLPINVFNRMRALIYRSTPLAGIGSKGNKKKLSAAEDMEKQHQGASVMSEATLAV